MGSWHMKHHILGAALFVSVSLGLAFVTLPAAKEFLTNRMAAAVGIDSWAVYDFEKQRGIRGEIAMGASGKDVRLVQEALAAIEPDFPEENITGYFGEETFAALREYQKKEGLEETGVLDTATRESLNALYFSELCPEGDGDTFEDEIMVHVNKEDALPKRYVPQDLVDISQVVKTIGIVCLKKDAVIPLKNMFKAAKKDGLELAVTSGFRKPEIQNILYWIWTAYEGDLAKDHVAEPRHSEHQLGTAVDLSGASNSNKSADPAFEHTEESAWLKAHAYEYGFIMSYPEGKKDITGYEYEPWHYRYVGKENAAKIHKKKLTIEEHLTFMFGASFLKTT